MKKLHLILMITPLIGFGQNLKNREVKINYSNGTEVFDVLINENTNISFDEDKEYFWYTEFTKIKTTQGGAGGLLLNGNYKFYNESGNLENDINYKLGLKHGIQKNWDTSGALILQNEYIEGEAVYTKFRNDEGIYISWENPIDPFSIQQSKGAIKKQFDKYNQLEYITKFVEFMCVQTTKYYTYSDQKEAEWFNQGTMGTGGTYYGKYTAWYSNGQIEVDGQYYEPEEFSMGGMICYECAPEIRVGTWTWYNQDGTIDSQSTYKADISYWNNGNIKSAGGLIKSADGEWLKHGKWIFHDENESWEKEEKKYDWGVEVAID